MPHTRSKGPPPFGFLSRNKKATRGTSEIERAPVTPIPLVHNQLFEEDPGYESDSASSVSTPATEPMDPNHHVQEQEEERFGDVFNSGTQHPMEFAYPMENINIPPHLISLVNNGSLFNGLDNEDPISHLNAFYELTGSHRPQGVPHDRIKRVLFSFSLRGKAREWYDSLPGYNIATFDELKQKFLTEYNPPAKIEKLRDAITSFKQGRDESFADAWKRFSDLLRKCPSHGLARGRELIKFYQGLSHESMTLINASTGGDLENLTNAQVRELFTKLATNQRNWYNPRKADAKSTETVGTAAGSERMDSLESQLASIATQLSTVVKIVTTSQVSPQASTPTLLTVPCGVCQGPHHMDQCPKIQGAPVEGVNYFGNCQGYNQAQYNNQNN